MGAEIFWRIIGPHPGWAQRSLWRKYFLGKRKICLESSPPTSRSQLIELCHKAAPLIRDRAYWIPGNDKEIKIWDDNIMMHPTLLSYSSLHVLRPWLERAGCIFLWEISLWAGNNWLRWSLPLVPPELNQECDLLLTLLNGKAPLRVGKKDARDWGAAPGFYTVAQGYKSLQECPHVPPDLAVWKGLWNYKSIPKVDSFCWLLCHKGILTEDRLKKKDFKVPLVAIYAVTVKRMPNTLFWIANMQNRSGRTS